MLFLNWQQSLQRSRMLRNHYKLGDMKKDNVQTKAEAVQEEAASGAAQAAVETETPAGYEVASVAEDTVPSRDEVPVQEMPAPGEAMKATIVLCRPGTEDLVEKIWRKMYAGEGLAFGTVPENPGTVAVLADLVADETVADRFVLVMPGCVPCCKVTEAELALPVVYVEKSGKRLLDHGLPMVFDKDILVDVLAQAGDKADSETVLEAYNRAAGVRPVEVGMSFGNYVTPVRRAVPCENRVIEALLKKKFLLCSSEGFRAIRNILEKHAG